MCVRNTFPIIRSGFIMLIKFIKQWSIWRKKTWFKNMSKCKTQIPIVPPPQKKNSQTALQSCGFFQLGACSLLEVGYLFALCF